jgi:hypothetical protein
MTFHAYGPENAEFELRKAYHVVTEGMVPHFWQERRIPGVDPSEPAEMYRHAYQAYEQGNRLAAERWARAAKHLSRAFIAEAKIAFLQNHDSQLPFLEGGSPDAFQLPEGSDTTVDLLNSVAEQAPSGQRQMPQAMSRYLSRARMHLKDSESSSHSHELLQAERIRAAFEYGRVLEIMALAYEAEATRAKSA